MIESKDIFHKFSELICKQTGLHLYDKDMDKLRRTVDARVKSGAYPNSYAYYHYLLGGGHEKEWESLMILLTCGESHFFRDKGQLNLLKDRILPDLIRRFQDKKSLKIWSAGCSTGEEPYTMAILLNELLGGDRSNWKITIVGSDINPESIKQAQQGLYRDWSMRGTDDVMIRSHFRKHSSGWRLQDHLRNMVDFHQIDLTGDPFPHHATGLCDFDLIICRNVFIYYGQLAIDKIMRKFAGSLAEGGYLLTGHAEVANPEKSGLMLRSFPESTIFQRVADCTPIVTQSASIIAAQLAASLLTSTQTGRKKVPMPGRPLHAPPAKPQKQRQVETVAATDPMADAEKLFSEASYLQASQLLKPYLRQYPRDQHAQIMLARCYANMGHSEEAGNVCQAVTNSDALCVDAYYIQAQLAQDAGRFNQARQLLQKTIYLSPRFIPAHLDLADIYQHAGEAQKARKERQAVYQLLQRLAADTKIKHLEDVSVDEILTHVKSMLDV